MRKRQTESPPAGRTVMLLSGGMDSATLLYHLLDQGRDVVTVTINYGQRHVKEIVAAQAVLRHAKEDFRHRRIRYHFIDLSFMGALLPGSSQTDPRVDVPKGHYADPTMRATVVPNRNMMLLSIAASIGIANGCDTIAYGAHAGDHDIYPDCRMVFVGAMKEALRLCHYDDGISLIAPFVSLDKGDICKRGIRLEVPYAATWTCYEGRELACGKCGACVERLEAFAKAECEDPVYYEKDVR